MTYIRKLWILAFLCGIITIISLLTPTAMLLYSTEYGSYTEIQWMWGLLFYDIKDYGYDYFVSGFDFLLHAPWVFIPGLIISIIMLNTAIINIISSVSLRKPSRKFTSIKKFWILSGVLQIVSGIIYFIAMEVGFTIYKLFTTGHSVSFWEYRIPSFGIIVPIICGALCIIGVIAGHALSNREELSRPSDSNIRPKISSLTQAKINSQESRTMVSSSFNYCPECGNKIYKMNSKFCTNCGISLVQY